MRTVKDWKVIEDWPTGYHNPRRSILVRDKRGMHILASGHGSGDDVEVYREGDDYYVLSMRRSFPYVGLTYFAEPDAHPPYDQGERWPKLTPTEPTHDVFAQGSEQVADYLGHHRVLERLTPMTIAKRLSEWCYS